MDDNVWQESPGTASVQTVSVVVDHERLRQVETRLQQLNLPPLVPTGVNLPRSEAQDRRNEPSETCVRGHCKHGRDESFFAMACRVY